MITKNKCQCYEQANESCLKQKCQSLRRNKNEWLLKTNNNTNIKEMQPLVKTNINIEKMKINDCTNTQHKITKSMIAKKNLCLHACVIYLTFFKNKRCDLNQNGSSCSVKPTHLSENSKRVSCDFQTVCNLYICGTSTPDFNVLFSLFHFIPIEQFHQPQTKRRVSFIKRLWIIIGFSLQKLGNPLKSFIKTIMMSKRGFPAKNREFPVGNPQKFHLADYWYHNSQDSLWKSGNPQSFIKRLWCHNRGFNAKNWEVWKVSTTKFQKFQKVSKVSNSTSHFKSHLKVSHKQQMRLETRLRFQLCIKPTGFLVLLYTNRTNSTNLKQNAEKFFYIECNQNDLGAG